MKIGRIRVFLLAMAILVAAILLLPNLVGVGDNTPDAKTRMRLDVVATLLQDFKQKFGRFPTNDEGIEGAARLKVNVDQSLKTITTDGWGNPFLYQLDASWTPKVYSRGKNGQDENGNGDDILMPSIAR